MINLKICGEMLCLVNKLKDLKKQHPVSNHKKRLLPTEPRKGCGFLCFLRVLFFVLRWKSEESFLPMEFIPHSAFTGPCQNV